MTLVLATAGFWSSLTIGGSALLVLGVVTALSASLPHNDGREDAVRERGLFFSCVGAALSFIGTAQRLWPHANSFWSCVDLVILGLVAGAIVLVIRRTLRKAGTAAPRRVRKTGMAVARRVRVTVTLRRVGSHNKLGHKEGPQEPEGEGARQYLSNGVVPPGDGVDDNHRDKKGDPAEYVEAEQSRAAQHKAREAS